MSNWKERLRSIFRNPERGDEDEAEPAARTVGTDAAGFVGRVVMPAFHALSDEIRSHGREVSVEQWDDGASLTMSHEGAEDLSYAIQVRPMKKMTVAFPELPEETENGEPVAEVLVNEEPQKRKPLTELTQEAIIEDFLNECDKWVDW